MREPRSFDMGQISVNDVGAASCISSPYQGIKFTPGKKFSVNFSPYIFSRIFASPHMCYTLCAVCSLLICSCNNVDNKRIFWK